MKYEKAVIVEYLADDGGWSWYSVNKGISPADAVKAYAKEHGLEDEVIETKEDGVYLGDEYARAYEINIYVHG